MVHLLDIVSVMAGCCCFLKFVTNLSKGYYAADGVVKYNTMVIFFRREFMSTERNVLVYSKIIL